MCTRTENHSVTSALVTATSYSQSTDPCLNYATLFQLLNPPKVLETKSVEAADVGMVTAVYKPPEKRSKVRIQLNFTVQRVVGVLDCLSNDMYMYMYLKIFT